MFDLEALALRVDVMDVAFDNVTLEEAVGQGIALLEGDKPSYVVTPNPEIVWACRENPALAQTVRDAALVLPDGIGVIYASRILKRPLKQKVAGIEFAERMAAEAAGRGKSLFLLGAKPGIAERAAEHLVQKYPGLVIAGTHDGYFKEDEPVVQQVRESGADLLFVCLGFPKQELWMAQHGAATGAKLMIGLGGSLDVFAGTVNRAPAWMVRVGLEWFYRLIQEPWRFKRMCRLPLFLVSAMGARLRGK